MSGSGVFELLIVVVLVTRSASFVVPEIRYQFKLMRSGSWPVVQGAVQKGEFLHAGPTKYLQLPFRSLLGYAYNVNNDPYWGSFVLAAEDRNVAEKLRGQADRQPVSVKYDPKRPQISALVDRVLLGRRLIQDPMWLS